MNIALVEQGVKVLAFEGAAPFYLKCSAATCEPRHEWYSGCNYSEENRARPERNREDRLFAALFRTRLEVGASVTFVATTGMAASLDGETLRAEHANHDVKLFHDWQAKNEAIAEESPSWIWQLILAADQFLVSAAFRKSLMAGASSPAITGSGTGAATP